MRREVSAGVILSRYVEQRLELLVLRENRRNTPGHWVFPKGHIEPGESPLQAALRELDEEAGISLDGAQPLHVTTHSFDGRHGPTEKTVHWFVGRDRSEALPSPGAGFAEARWVTPEQAQELLVHDSDRDLARRVALAAS
jgi:8-oxo-dGTP pyrophosphatase MutT (NUDIX family)